MRPVRGTEAHLTDNLAELVCSNSFRSDDAANNAVGLLHEEMRRAGSLIMRAADAAQAAGRRRARRRPPRLLRRRAADAARPSAGRAQARGGGGPAARRLGQRHRRHRPPHLAGARRGDPHAERRGSARLLRRHRAHRAPREHRSVDRLEAVALRQGRPGRRRRRLSQLPARQGGVRGLRRGPAGGRQDRVQGVGAQHALLQRLPADRGDRRQRTADAALRADEAGRPARPAHRPSPVGRRAASPGQCARHAVEHRGLPDQAEARRADAPVPHHPRPAGAPSSRGWAGCIATPSSTARACSTPRCA